MNPTGLPPADAPSIARVEAHLRARLAAPLPGHAAQHRFAPRGGRHTSPPPMPPDARRAAVLLLVYPGALGPTLPLTVRHAQLAKHAGQISLPGGAVDPGESPEMAALRETREEIGVPADDLRVVGALTPLWVFVSRFAVHPFVAVTDREPAFVPDPREVDTLLHVPLAHLTTPSRVKETRRFRDGMDLTYPYFALDGDHELWGATAMILGEFIALLDTPSP